MLDHFNKQTASQLTFTQFMGENMRYHSSAASDADGPKGRGQVRCSLPDDSRPAVHH
ncbi:hypothetical protein ACW18Z_03425 [Limosilactobacillus fermentum]